MNQDVLPHVVELTGGPRQQGRIHGETLRDVIQETMARWRERFEPTLTVSFDEYAGRAHNETGLRRAIEKWTPDLLEEVEGIAEGAGLPFKTAFAWQLLDEHCWLTDWLDVKRAGNESGDCSSLGLVNPATSTTLVGQNLDLPVTKNGAQTLLRYRCPDSDGETLVVTQAGAIASLGLNSHRLGVCVNSLTQLDTTAQGLPVTCVIRGILKQKTLREAGEFLREITHATGHNYLIGVPGEVLDVECSVDEVTEFIPTGNASHRYHSNHPVVNTNQAAYREIPEGERNEATRGDLFLRTTESRLDYLALRTGNPDLEVSLDSMKDILQRPDVCLPLRPGVPNFSAVCAIMDLASRPCLHLAAGPPDRTKFKTYQFTDASGSES